MSVPGAPDNNGLYLRTAVCDWMVNNIDAILEQVPPGVPRQVVYRSDYGAWYMFMAQGLGYFVAAMAVLAYVVCTKYQNTKVLLFAQPVFVKLILIGFALIAIGGGVLPALPPGKTCTVEAWLLVLGFTIELTPVVVKTSAINKLMKSSRHYQRVNISRKWLLFKVAAVVTAVTAFLTAWTILDDFQITETKTLNPNDSSEVQWDIMCGSDLQLWGLAVIFFQGLLLLWAAVLAYQSRDTMAQLNESKSLAWMVYSHVMFLILRGVFVGFRETEALPGSTIAVLMSINYSLDALFAMMIYVCPKLVEAAKASEPYRPGTSSKVGSSGMQSKPQNHSEYGDYDNLQLLVCTANMGNAEPTLESLRAWIPQDGDSSRVTPLSGKSNQIPKERFDVIAIGMQEATWKEKKKEKQLRTSALSEEEILNSMEEQNTAYLRESVQEILGNCYVQLVGEQRGQMRFQLWASVDVQDDVHSINISGANTGIGNILANKGGIVTSFTYKKTRISFLSAHLAAHEGKSYYKARCDNLETILREGAKTSAVSQKLDASLFSHMMFIIGDLNFRTDFGDENETHEGKVQRALAMIESKSYDHLYSFDELQKGLENGDLLSGFRTLKCNFPPTFKVEREPGLVYKKQRTPSYTDRILFKNAPGMSENLRPLAYELCEDFVTSDHKPIRGAFSIMPNTIAGPILVTSQYEIEISRMKCVGIASKRRQLTTKLPPATNFKLSGDLYLMFLWDSEDVKEETISLKDKVRKFFKGSAWPRTSLHPNTTDPDWGDETKKLVIEDCSIWQDQMLYIALNDYDPVQKHECLGVIALNTKDLITMGRQQDTKVIHIDQPLLMGGTHAGVIQLQVTIKRDSRGGNHRRSQFWGKVGSALFAVDDEQN